ncbi:hypothetical protein [Methanolapillus ohkumae]|uniref:Uncharacterized protein n=1 Tax=Methanolapillus ohkumae TaxID=3028298 RepID=A0AA96V7R1_9EURY|nr:hypothetical protein MsAm2_05700 [Methanosarcinaceae archaeon Am2]
MRVGAQEKIILVISIFVIALALIFTAFLETGVLNPKPAFGPEMVQVRAPPGFHDVKTSEFFIENETSGGGNNVLGYSGFYAYVTYEDQLTPTELEFWEMPLSDIFHFFQKPGNWMKPPGDNPNNEPSGVAFINVTNTISSGSANEMAAGLADMHFIRSGNDSRFVMKDSVNSMPGYRYAYTIHESGKDVFVCGYIWTVGNIVVTVDGVNVDSKPMKLLAKCVRFE